MKYSLSILFLLVGVSLAATDSAEIRDRVQLADGLFRRNMFDLAAREYATLAAIPDVIDQENILFRLGESYRRSNQPKEADETYKKLLEKYPKSLLASRAQLQRAILQADGDAEAQKRASATLALLTVKEMPPEIQQAAYYHLGELLERQKRQDEALANYEQLIARYPSSDYGMYATLRAAWILTQTKKEEDRKRAIELYLNMAFKASNPKASEEGFYFAAQLALNDTRYEAAANLFQLLKTRFPGSQRVKESLLPAAWAYYYSGRFKEAIESLLPLLSEQQHASREEILYLLANAYAQLEKRSEAIQYYTVLVDEFPRGKYLAPARYERIVAMFRDSKYEDVLVSAPQFLYPPDNIADHLYWICAESAMALQRSAEAIQYCRRLIEKCPKSQFVKDALYRLGWLNQKDEAWEATSTWFLQLAQKFPQDPLAAKSLYLSGVCRAKLGQNDAALRDWTQLLMQYPDHELAPEALYQKAMEEIKAKNIRSAGVTLDERIRRFPGDARKAEVFYWRGSIFRQLEEYGEAEKMFKASLAANPAKEFERECMLELGMILYQQGRKEEAATYFQKLMDAPIAEKLGADRLAWLAEFQYGQKNYSASIQAAKTLLAQPDNRADKGWKQTAWALIGRAHLAKVERDAAIRAFTEALATGATTEFGTEAALRLGELMAESGKYDEAIRYLTDAAAKASTPAQVGVRARAYMGLAKASQSKGDEDAALRYYMSVGILFDNPVIVPEALTKAAALLDKHGRAAEATAMREELKARYPQTGAGQTSQKNDGNAQGKGTP